MNGLGRRFYSRREKHRDGGEERKHKLPLQPELFSPDLLALVADEDKGKKPEKDEDKKIKALVKRLRISAHTSMDESHADYALRSKYSNGDPEKAYDLLILYETAAMGVIQPYDQSVKLLGAQNRQKVTCYLDALLFAMFARMDGFEGMLSGPTEDESKRNLATILRLWVNMLRGGRLITTDITKNLQDAMAGCGWKEAAEIRQQDVSEAFTFITEKLKLPQLRLKMDIFHTGKEAADDDHKFVTERLLEVAIPEFGELKTEDESQSEKEGLQEVEEGDEKGDTKGEKKESGKEGEKGDTKGEKTDGEKEGGKERNPEVQIEDQKKDQTTGQTGAPTQGQEKGEKKDEKARVITLEDCLEAYFNNRIEVKREMARRATLGSVHSRDDSKSLSMHVETIELGSSPSTPLDSSFTQDTPLSRSFPTPGGRLNRSSSIIREKVITEDTGASSSNAEDETFPPRRRRGNTIKKEVLMPAWQFFSLLPWYTEDEPQNDSQIAVHFATQRPIFGICLKRYSVLPNQTAVRLNTVIDIPLEIGLPQFIQDDRMGDNGSLHGNFKLALQSVVCHRGNSVESGHYISLVRDDARKPGPESNTSLERPDSAGLIEETWMKYDDLAAERVTHVDIKKALQEESPYLLFYQVQPIDQPPVFAAEDAPPAYQESDLALEDSISADPASSWGDSRKPSVDLAPPQMETPARLSMSSEKFRYVGSTGEGGEGRSSLAPNDRPGSGIPSRKPSKSGGKGERQGRTSSQLNESKLGATFQRLTDRLSRERLEPSQIDANHDDDTTTPHGASKSKKEKKKDKGKRSKSTEPKQIPHWSGTQPDRECSIM
ncbi:MAG: hypothetical protein M4579_006402 [Chaenotheca gracillima]|nr:MAG: hypothetical protein M4579_006402 [Chaenotheca gracillima]